MSDRTREELLAAISHEAATEVLQTRVTTTTKDRIGDVIDLAKGAGIKKVTQSSVVRTALDLGLTQLEEALNK